LPASIQEKPAKAQSLARQVVFFCWPPNFGANICTVNLSQHICDQAGSLPPEKKRKKGIGYMSGDLRPIPTRMPCSVGLHVCTNKFAQVGANTLLGLASSQTEGFMHDYDGACVPRHMWVHVYSHSMVQKEFWFIATRRFGVGWIWCS